jgi:hypothetical protein
MNNNSTYAYSFFTIKNEFYNDFKGKSIKKGSFANDDSPLKILYLRVRELSKKGKTGRMFN